MKNALLSVERALLAFGLIRLLVLLLDKFARRLLWLWGRIRFGVMVRNRGSGCVCHWNADLKFPENIYLGDGVVIGVNASLGAHSRIDIGNRVRISRDVVLETAGLDFADLKPPYAHRSSAIAIQEGVWIGSRALVLGGVTIGAHSVIAAGSVVVNSVPPYCVVAGVPARVVRQLGHNVMETS